MMHIAALESAPIILAKGSRGTEAPIFHGISRNFFWFAHHAWSRLLPGIIPGIIVMIIFQTV